MARSKARQAKQWLEEFNTSSRDRHTLPSVRFGRTPQEMIARDGKLDFDPLTLNYPASELVSLIRLTSHAKYRMAQRNLSNEEISYVLLYGQSWHKAGATITYLRQKDIPFSDRADQQLQRLMGAIVVTAADSERVILTAYRNRRSGLRNIKHKPNYGWNYNSII
jgi:hypothetical protein